MKKPSVTAQEVSAVKEQYMHFLKSHSRVPQPTFWLAFASRVKLIRQKKELNRAVKELLESI
jgi:hypothetical protein